MTNFEFYKDEILKMCDEGTGVRVFTLTSPAKLYPHTGNPCCSCSSEILRWLYAEHIEKPTLNKYERALCEALQTGWIARNLISNELWWYEVKPIKDDECWYTKKKVGSGYINFSFYSVMNANPEIKFDFIKWDDEETWSVEELLKLEVRE